MELENLTKWVGALAPFIAPYPSWVKICFALSVLSGAMCFIGLVVAAPTATTPEAKLTAASTLVSNTASSAWLTIRGVSVFGRDNGPSLKITATVNGIEYLYPNLSGVKWLKIGPDMASQSYELPQRAVYFVRFKALTRDGLNLISVEEQHVTKQTDGTAQYELHQVNSDRERQAPIAATVKYTITRGSP